MKKAIAIMAIMAIIAMASFTVGMVYGIQHAIEDSVIFTTEAYDPNNPYENLRPDGTDQTIWIELDDDIYEHGMYQG